MELYWQLSQGYESVNIDEFAKNLNSSPVLAKILLNRGIDNIEAARKYFIPKLENLHDPFSMHDMEAAVTRVIKAMANKEKSLVYGDYDVDGTTATSMMSLFFREIGYPIEYYIPDRILEGYGVSEKGVKVACEKEIKLIITVDCGITAINEIKFAKEKGIDVIICDHHQPGSEMPPAHAILNPKREDCSYPFKELAGVGVAFKLLQALQQKLNLEESQLFNYLYFVAIGSAADILPLID